MKNIMDISKTISLWILFGPILMENSIRILRLCADSIVSTPARPWGWHPYGDNTYVELFQRLFYVDDYNVFRTNYNDLELNRIIWSIYKENDTQIQFKMRANIAFAVQTVLEECVIQQLNYLYDYTKCLNLCFAGGTALNSILNFKILEKTPFSSVYIMPAASDTGTAIGSALYAYYEYSGKPKASSWLENPCIDMPYDKEEHPYRTNCETPFVREK